ncbi:MAG: HAD family hydrolase [Pseudonocardiaceae bacterium]
MLALLDLDETLVDRKAGFQVWAQALVKEHALGDEALAWLTATDLAVTERGRFFALVGERFPVVGSPGALWDDYSARMPYLAPVFPGVLDALARLRTRDWRLGVVTNGRVDNQLGKLRRSGVLDLLDGWCVSEETGDPQAGSPDLPAGPGAVRGAGSAGTHQPKPSTTSMSIAPAPVAARPIGREVAG